MWLLIGYCSYFYECDCWKIGCGVCLYLDEYLVLSRDIIVLLWRIKKEVYKCLKIVFVVINNWMKKVF